MFETFSKEQQKKQQILIYISTAMTLMRVLFNLRVLNTLACVRICVPNSSLLLNFVLFIALTRKRIYKRTVFTI